jgi:hypothetical protein
LGRQGLGLNSRVRRIEENRRPIGRLFHFASHQ